MSDMHLSKLKEISAGTNYESPNGMNYAARAFNKNQISVLESRQLEIHHGKPKLVAWRHKR